MEMKKRKLFKNVVLNSDAKENTVILEGSFTEFNVGSRAFRFWVGFGAGKTYLKAKGRLIDAQTGKELASFEDQPFLKPGKDQKPKVGYIKNLTETLQKTTSAQPRPLSRPDQAP
jgi:hypothetical protein